MQDLLFLTAHLYVNINRPSEHPVYKFNIVKKLYYRIKYNILKNLKNKALS